MNIEEIKKILGQEFTFFYDVIMAILDELKLSKEAEILDIGTGQGRMAITLALNGYRVLTGEPGDDTTEYAKKDWLESAKKVRVEHLITFKEYNAENMPFEKDYFDAIFILGAIHHISDKIAALNECIRTLKQNGVICIIEPNAIGMKIVRKKYPTHPDPEDPREYEKILPISVDFRKGQFFDGFLIKVIE